MNTDNHIKPEFREGDFNCPFCNAHSQQHWYHLYQKDDYRPGYTTNYSDILILYRAICNKCEESSFWLVDEQERSSANPNNAKMIYPKILTAPLAHTDMPNSAKDLYEEARNISNDSPRAAAALLRSALEKLTEALGENTGDLNTRIGNLVKRGLSSEVQQALDTVRITANEGGSHPGQIDLTGEDGQEVVDRLFWLVNFVVEKMITEPKSIAENFNNLPAGKKQGVQNRDKGQSS